MIAIKLCKQQALNADQKALDADQKAIQQINVTENLARDPIANTTMFFNIEETKESALDFPQRTVRVF